MSKWNNLKSSIHHTKVLDELFHDIPVKPKEYNKNFIQAYLRKCTFDSVQGDSGI